MAILKRDVSHMVGHPYFRGSEGRDEKGSGLETALAEIEARRLKSVRLRAMRLTGNLSGAKQAAQ
jgi:hypothetical protein